MTSLPPALRFIVCVLLGSAIALVMVFMVGSVATASPAGLSEADDGNMRLALTAMGGVACVGLGVVLGIWTERGPRPDGPDIDPTDERIRIASTRLRAWNEQNAMEDVMTGSRGKSDALMTAASHAEPRGRSLLGRPTDRETNGGEINWDEVALWRRFGRPRTARASWL